MKLNLSLQDSSIFKKIMAVFMAALLPIMAITWLINEKGSESIREERSQSILNTTRYYLDSLDKEADRINRFLPNYVTDSDLQEIAAMGNELSDYDRSQKILGIQKRLNLTKDSSAFIQEVKAYVPLIQRTLLSVKYDTFVDVEEYEALQFRNKRPDEPFVFWDDRLFLSMQVPSNSAREPLYVVGVELSTAKIRQSLAQISGSFGGETLLINTDRGWNFQSGEDPGMLTTAKAFIAQKSAEGKKQGYETVTVGSDRYLAVYNYSPLWNSYSVSCIPENTLLGPIQTYRVWFRWACVLAVAVVLFFSYFLFRLIYRPLFKLVQSFRRVQQNRLELIPVDRGNDEFGYLYHAFNQTIHSLRELIEQNYEQQIRSQRSELKRLQSQINPHFLYNCFFVLCRLIKSEHKEKAYQFCLYIGDYFHFITRNDEDEIPLSLEINHSRTYVDMQKVCYGDRIGAVFEVEEFDTRVPRLILQPIIENAYKHALGSTPGAGLLRIWSRKDAKGIAIYVEDNGTTLTNEELGKLRMRLTDGGNELEETTGLVNVHRRIQLRYGTGYGITVERSDLGGLKAGIHIGNS